MFLRLQLRAGAEAAAETMEATGSGLLLPCSTGMEVDIDVQAGVMPIPGAPNKPESADAQKVQCVQTREGT